MPSYEEIKKVKDQVAAKAWADKEFRKELKANPTAALQKLFGASFPKSVEVKLFEDNQKTLNIVIPEANEKQGELSEEELSSVSGGWGCICDCFNVTCFTLGCL